MVNCAVYGCKSNNNKKLKDNDGVAKKIRFFGFPKNDKIAQQWKVKCRRSDNFNINNSRVCDKHFTPGDYLKNLRHELLQYSPAKSRKLKDDAVPTLNLPSSGINVDVPCSSRQLREQVREQKAIVKELLAQTPDENVNPDLPILEITVDEPEWQNNDFTTKLTTLEIKVDNLKKQNEQLYQTNKNLNAEIMEMTKANLKQNEQIELLTSETRGMKKIFSSGQIQKLNQPFKKVHKWQVDDIVKAISLHAAGPRAYRFLRKNNHPLPDLSKLEKMCVIVADEMKIKKLYEYDKTNDSVLSPSNYVQVIMARGIIKNWKQPIFYAYDCQLSKQLVIDAINKLESIGCHVVALITDMGGGNRSLWKQLDITIDKPYFSNPVNSKKVFVFVDVPHLIKLIRNHFIDSGFMIEENLINKQPLEELLEKTSASELNIANKLSSHHLTVKNAGRQKVKFATQLFSNSVSSNVSRMGTLGLCKSSLLHF